MKNKGLLALAGLGAVAYLAANSTTPEQKADLAALGFTGAGNLTAEDVVRAIRGDSSLRAMLKGEPGAAGAAGTPGAQGEPGVAGEQIKAFGGSLVKNSALELNTTDGWTPATGGTITATDVFEGALVLNSTFIAAGGAVNSNKFYIDNRRLLKATFRGMSGGTTYRILLRRFNRLNTTIMHSSDINIYGLGNPGFNNTAMEQKTVFFGGIGTNTTSIGLNTMQGMLIVYSDAAGTVQVSHLAVTQVSLGEAVPYNLAYLPDGQTVYEPTTGKLGRYNGTAVVWNG